MPRQVSGAPKRRREAGTWPQQGARGAACMVSHLPLTEPLPKLGQPLHCKWAASPQRKLSRASAGAAPQLSADAVVNLTRGPLDISVIKILNITLIQVVIACDAGEAQYVQAIGPPQEREHGLQ
jgi:hypothetical protein